MATGLRVIRRSAKVLRVHPSLVTLAMMLCSGYQRITRRFAPQFLMGITAMAVMLAALSVIPASATTYTVTSLADSGAGSLREYDSQRRLPATLSISASQAPLPWPAHLRSIPA